jgi:hypothetical protein
MRAPWLLVIAGALLSVAGCGSPSSGPEVRRRGDATITGAPEEGTWKEADLQPPPYPKDVDLIDLKLTGARTSTRFSVDGSSLSIGPDKVIRFVLAIRSGAGATTVSFSGLRCATKEWKDYAFGRSDRTWARVEDAKWRPIRFTNYNNFQDTLYNDYFCYGGYKGGGIMGDAKALVNRLKYPPVRDSTIPNKELR